MTTKLYPPASIARPTFVLDSQARFLGADIPDEFYQGKKPGSIKGKMLEEVFPGEMSKVFKELWIRGVRGTTSKTSKLIGQEQYLISVVPFRNEEGLLLIRYSLQKISHPKVDYKETTGLQEKFRAAFNSGFSLKVMLKQDLEIVAINDGFREFFEASDSDDGSGLPLHELKSWKSSNIHNLRKAIERCAPGKQQRYLDSFTDGCQGYFFQVSVQMVSVKDQPVLYMVNLQDVSELEKSRTELSEIRLQHEKQENEFKQMAYMVSHDLRGPATNISYLLSLLDNSQHEGEDAEVMGALKTSAQKILETLENVGGNLNERMQAQEATQPTLRRRIDEALEALKTEIGRKNARVVVDIYDNSDWNIPEGILKMALTQLLSNSLKYSKPGLDPEIIITAFRQDGKRIIRVKDNGIGIKLEGRQQRLFGMFQTFHQHPEARGVGLFQVKSRLKSIGGDVFLESEEGKGTIVTLNFN